MILDWNDPNFVPSVRRCCEFIIFIGEFGQLRIPWGLHGSIEGFRKCEQVPRRE